MQESEIRRWADYKAKVVAEIQSHGTGWYLSRYKEALVDTDERIGEYCCENIAHPSKHNLYEILSVRRFFKMLDRHEWDKKLVRKFIKFYQALRFSGLNGRQRYKLTPVQTFQFANLFGFKDDDGNRLIQNAIWFVPRKFSKTTSAAALAVWELFFGDDKSLNARTTYNNQQMKAQNGNFVLTSDITFDIRYYPQINEYNRICWEERMYTITAIRRFPERGEMQIDAQLLDE